MNSTYTLYYFIHATSYILQTKNSQMVPFLVAGHNYYLTIRCKEVGILTLNIYEKIATILTVSAVAFR